MASPRRLRENRGTIILVACCAVLLLCVPLASLLLPLTKPQTVEQAREEVSASVEAVVQTIPAELVLSDDQTSTEAPCLTEDGARVVQLRRVVVVADLFDLRGWPGRLREQFSPHDGWHVRVHALDLAGAVMISLRGPDLSLVPVRTGDTDAGSELTMTSWSSCTAT